MSDPYASCRVGACIRHSYHCERCCAPIPYFHRGMRIRYCRSCWEHLAESRPLFSALAGLIEAHRKRTWLSEPVTQPGFAGEGLHMLELRKRYPCRRCWGRGDPKCDHCLGRGFSWNAAAKAGELRAFGGMV